MTITEGAAIATAATATCGVILSVVKFWIARSDLATKALVSATRADLLKAIASNMERQFADLDKATYVTLDYRMDGDVSCLRIPLCYNRVTECLQGMRLQLVEHSKTETVYSVSTLGYHAPIRLHWHYHEEMEMVQVIRGTVTDVKTGVRYEAGQTWMISPGERHIADFSDAYVLCTVRPPLPFATEHPMNLGGIVSVYDSPEPH